MKYLLTVYSPESAWTPEEWNDCVSISMKICEELASRQQLLSAAPLHPVATAETVRVRDGKPCVTTGPFAETVEQLGGFYVIDVEDLDEAIAIATRLPPTTKGTIEIRPLHHMDGLPSDQWERLESEYHSLQPYMLLCYDDEPAWAQAGEDALEEARQDAVRFTHDLQQMGYWISASPLHPSATATSVRIRDGNRIIFDGPFAETREILGGYYVLLLPSQVAAMELAMRHPGVHFGAVEVRQVFDLRSSPKETVGEVQ